MSGSSSPSIFGSPSKAPVSSSTARLSSPNSSKSTSRSSTVSSSSSSSANAAPFPNSSRSSSRPESPARSSSSFFSNLPRSCSSSSERADSSSDSRSDSSNAMFSSASSSTFCGSTFTHTPYCSKFSSAPPAGSLVTLALCSTLSSSLSDRAISSSSGFSTGSPSVFAICISWDRMFHIIIGT